MEVNPENSLLFVTSGSGSSANAVVLDVFDVTSLPGTVPTAPVQSISFAGAGAGIANLELSPDGTKLAVMISADNHPNVTLYDVAYAPTPLTLSGTFSFNNGTGTGAPNDIHFSPDGNLLFVSGGNGFFSVLDLRTTPPATLINAATWTTQTTTTHGSAVATSGGTLVALAGEPSTAAANFLVFDLNRYSPTFATNIGSFTSNPNGNISNMRSHARQNIVVAIDGTGATANCQWVDVIDMDQPLPAGGFANWRVQMPSFTTLTPAGLTCIPRDFDMY